MPKVDINTVPLRSSCAYPAPYDAACMGREKQALGDAGGLDQFGVNLTRLQPGAASSHRHWHKAEDEFIYILHGEVVLEEDDGDTVLRAGEAASFKAGIANGHRLINRSAEDCLYLEIGTRSSDDVASYTDPKIDMRAEKKNGAPWRMTRKDGTPF